MILTTLPRQFCEEAALVVEVFYAGRDFLIEQPGHPLHGRGTSKHDYNFGEEIRIRYNNKRKTVTFTYRVH